MQIRVEEIIAEEHDPQGLDIEPLQETEGSLPDHQPPEPEAHEVQVAIVDAATGEHISTTRDTMTYDDAFILSRHEQRYMRVSYSRNNVTGIQEIHSVEAQHPAQGTHSAPQEPAQGTPGSAAQEVFHAAALPCHVCIVWHL